MKVNTRKSLIRKFPIERSLQSIDALTNIFIREEYKLHKEPQVEDGWQKWISAIKTVGPIFLGTRLAILFISYFFTLFIYSKPSSHSRSSSDLFLRFIQWDSVHYIHIAQYGYTNNAGVSNPRGTVFFPLYPLLIHVLNVITKADFAICALIITNLAAFGLLVVFYQLTKEEFGASAGFRTVLAHVLFPSAFFLIVIYNHSLFLFLSVLCFYYIRKGNWWLAGLCGFFASLTRSSGCFLCFPFLYEYLRQHEFSLRTFNLRKLLNPGILAIGLIPAGTLLFACYCYSKFNDFLSFQHAEEAWRRWLDVPWYALVQTANAIIVNPLLSYQGVRALADLFPVLFTLLLVVLGFVGPWKFSKEKLVYPLYGALVFLFFLSEPTHTSFVMESQGRYMLEVFPAFMVMGRIGKAKPQWGMLYVFSAYGLQILFLLQFMLGNWVD